MKVRTAKLFLVPAFMMGLIFWVTLPSFADDYVLTLTDHAFTPANLTVPSGQKIKLVVKNNQSIPAEFESSDLEREKLIAPGGQIIVLIGPLNAGSYNYLDDFHRETKGTIVAQ